jgi:hypothetical protein
MSTLDESRALLLRGQPISDPAFRRQRDETLDRIFLLPSVWIEHAHFELSPEFRAAADDHRIKRARPPERRRATTNRDIQAELAR